MHGIKIKADRVIHFESCESNARQFTNAGYYEYQPHAYSNGPIKQTYCILLLDCFNALYAGGYCYYS